MNFRKRAKSRRNSTHLMTGKNKWQYQSKKMLNKDDDDEDDDSDDENELEIAPRIETDWEESFFGTKDSISDKSDQDLEVHLTKKQTFILATLTPDDILLLDEFTEPVPKKFVGVLLMADVSGYTSLSERYQNTGKGGTYRLTATLNNYLGSLIELIYGHGGDVLKFAGDAFLALWKADKRVFLCHTIHKAITCALLIQHLYGVYETDVKVNLKVKLAISAGNIIFSPIGTGNDLNYVVVGLPVLEAKFAESKCNSGEVTMSETAWGHCYSRNYEHTVHEGYVIIKTILYDPHEPDVCKPFQGFGSNTRQPRKKFPCLEDISDLAWHSSTVLNEAERTKRLEVLSMRKTILQAEERDIGPDIRKFMIRPVLQQVDAHQPLEYLTEMRQVTVMFLTMKPIECPFLQLITIVDKAYQITSQIVYASMGCVNKIILFDKDIMILVIFGLRGFKHESEAQIALKCAYSVKKSISCLDGVLQVSIGVTTGQVYCGVVGHPLRREFTVIGAVVNKAARIMCYFKDKVSCDELTFVNSKMSKNSFILQPKINLKGILDAGKLYEYTEEIRAKKLHDIDTILPLLGRKDEIEYFGNWLDQSHTSYREFDALLIIGESRIGKSRLLEYMGWYAKNNGFRACLVTLTSIHSATLNLAVNQIMNQILDLPDTGSGFLREEAFVKQCGFNADLCYLNSIFRLRFACHEGVYTQNEETRKQKAKSMFEMVIQNIDRVCFVAIDDLHNLDSSSWEFIEIMIKVKKIFIVMALTRVKFGSVKDWLYQVFISKNIRKMEIGPLSTEWIAPLACQILNVSAVPEKLCYSLRVKCKGNPGLVETFIIHLFSSDALKVTEYDEWVAVEEHSLIFPETELLQPLALDYNEQQLLETLCQNEGQQELTICLVNLEEELIKRSINVQNIEALIMTQIDSLTPYQQLLLKIASVIGDVFSRELIEGIMYENNSITTAKAVKRLFSMRLLSCANITCQKYRRSVRSISAHSTFHVECECVFDFDPEEHDNIPKYAFCKLIRFKNKSSRLACYELLPMNQKKEFHTRIVNFLQVGKHKCSSCGGGIVVAQSYIGLNEVDSETAKVKKYINKNFKKSLSFDESNSDSQDDDNDDDNVEIKGQSAIYDEFYASDLRQTKSESVVNSDNTIYDNASVKDDTAIVPTPILKAVASDSLSGSRRLAKRVTVQGSELLRMINELDTHSIGSGSSNGPVILDMFREMVEAENIQDWNDIGVADSVENALNCEAKTSFSVRIEKGVSTIKFDECSCSEQAATIYEQLVHHATQAELKMKAIEFLIKCSSWCVSINNLENAIMKLDDAEIRCNDSDLKCDKTLSFDLKIFLGKIFTLRSTANMATGNLFAARIDIDRAAKIYGISLIGRKLSDDISGVGRQFIEVWKSRRKLRGKAAILGAESLTFLNVATVLFAALGEVKPARTTAYRALNILNRVEFNTIDACDAYSNAIHVELDRGRPEATDPIERSARNTLNSLANPVQSNQLRALGKLFMATLRARIARAHMASAIRAGFRSLVLCRLIHADEVAVEIVPDLFYLLIARLRIPEAVDVVSDLWKMAKRHSNLECETWYFALCLDLILDGGFQIEPVREIVKFAEQSLEYGLVSGSARRRLAVNFWTFWLRAGMDRKAKRWEDEVLQWLVRDSDDGSFTSLLSALRLAEGMISSLSRKVDDLRKVVDLMQLRSLAESELASLESSARMCRTAMPRWLRLRAECSSLAGRPAAATATRAQSIEEANRMSNRLELANTLATSGGNAQGEWLRYARVGEFPNWRSGAARARTSWQSLLYRPSVAHPPAS